MENEFLSKYIDRLNNNISDLTKRLMILETQHDLANENLDKKEKQFEARWIEFEGEQNNEFNKKLAENNEQWLREVESMKLQRAQLQQECNSLREKYQNLEAAYLALSEKQSKKKKSAS